MRWADFYALTILLLLAPLAKAEVNLLDNGSFEEGNTGFTSGYRYSPGNLQPEGSYDVVTNPHNSHPLAPSYGDHTTETGKMLAFNGATTPGVVAWTETVVAPTRRQRLPWSIPAWTRPEMISRWTTCRSSRFPNRLRSRCSPSAASRCFAEVDVEGKQPL